MGAEASSVCRSPAAGGQERRPGDNGNNSILIENCYNFSIRAGTVNGGGEVRVAARSEFPNNKDVWVTMTVNNTTVRESPCGDNVNWTISGNASVNVC